MKKALKILVPLLLVVATLISIGWYLLVYDRDFTRDVLVSQARKNEEKGNYDLATWFYDLAYAYSDQDQDVAIELAEQYKSIGNYTKAEYTLSNAIADGGNAELYIALCKTYVEQDKLLDAVTMLDSISDTAIKAELDARRPAAPVATPESGFYSQYITVTVESTAGTLYVTTNGVYPSTAMPPYSEPITLPAGETTIYALSVAEDGLVSPLTVTGYTIGGVIEPVEFADRSIENALREQLGVGADTTVYTNDLWTITEFTVPEDAKTMKDLARLPYLTSLTIAGQDLEDLKFLSALTDLQALSLTDCDFPSDDLSIVASLPKLTDLTLADCSLSTIADLEGAKNLVTLDLSGNTVRNLEAISGMADLQELNLQHNAVTGLTALSGLNTLHTLDLSYNSITDISPLADCAGLRVLDVSQNQLTALAAVQELTALEQLNAAHNNLTDVAVLSNCTTLTKLDISNNAITDITALSALTAMTDFNFSHNTVTAIPAWPAECALIKIDGSYNQLENIDSLGDLHNLNHIMMDYNLLTNIDALANCHLLMSVNVYGNEIESVDALLERSIVVNFDPTN